MPHSFFNLFALWAGSVLLVVGFGCGGNESGTTSEEQIQSNAETSSPTSAANPSVLVGQLLTRSIDVDGVVRTYRVYVPTSYDPLRTESYALWLAFHGQGPVQTVDMEPMTKLVNMAEEHDFVLVYPEGSQSIDPCKPADFIGWNSGELDCDGSASCKQQYGNCREVFVADDVTFVRALVAELAATLSINQNRIVATGFSSGAVFSYVLACVASDVIRAFFPVSGYRPSLPNPIVGSQCQPSNPIQLLAFTGSVDPTYLFDPGNVETMSNLGTSNGSCQASPTVTRLPRIDLNDERELDHLVYPTCTPGSRVEEFHLHGGWHAYHGERGSMIRALLPEPCNQVCESTLRPIIEGLSSRNLPINEKIWEFLQDI